MSDEKAAKPPVREADQWKGSGGTGRFPQREPKLEQASELDREERRLERLRLVVTAWPPQEHFEDEPAAKPPVREADRWRGLGGTGRFPQLEPEGPTAA